MVIRKFRIIAALIAAVALGLVIYAGLRTSVLSQLGQLLNAHLLLAIALVALVILAALALACIIYGFGSEKPPWRSTRGRQRTK